MLAGLVMNSVGAALLASSGAVADPVEQTESPQAAAAEAPKVADPDAKPRNIYNGNYLVIGAGVIIGPSSEGSDHKVPLLAFGLMGRVRGIDIGARAGGIALDFIKDKPGAKLTWSIGPVIRLRGNPAKLPSITSLGTLKGTPEAGIAVGAQVHRLLDAYDSLSVGTDIRWDISSKSGGRVISPSVSYMTPVSRAQVVGLTFSADHVDSKFASVNYSVNAGGTTISTLPTYVARSGWRSMGLRAYTAYDLDRNLTNGGFSVAAGVSWSKILGSAAQSPRILRKSQFSYGALLAYTF
ncbi:MAG: MipA/OmpV family protein [Novosphingobium sp.]